MQQNVGTNKSCCYEQFTCRVVCCSEGIISVTCVIHVLEACSLISLLYNKCIKLNSSASCEQKTEVCKKIELKWLMTAVTRMKAKSIKHKAREDTI